MNLHTKNNYIKKVLKLYTDQLIGRRLLAYFNEYLTTITKEYVNEPTDKLLTQLKDYCISEHLTPNEKYGVAMIIRFSNEINSIISKENNGKDNTD